MDAALKVHYRLRQVTLKMETKCPKCKYPFRVIEPKRIKAGKNRWAGLSKEQRSEAMSKIRKKGLANKQKVD